MDFDDALKEVGSWGRFQITLYVLISLSAIPNAYLSIQFIFSHHEPKHHCKFPEEYASIVLNTTNGEEPFLQFALPHNTDALGKVTWSSCTMYNRNYSAYPVEDWTTYFNSSDEEISCKNGWVFELEPNTKSAVSEFSLVCDDDWKPPLVVSMYMAGTLVGSFFEAFADKFGRRPVFLGSGMLQVLFMVFTSFTWNFTSYITGAFMCGCVALVNYVTAFVLATEMSDVKWRNFFAMGAIYSFAVGYCMVSLFAYLFQDWRTLLLVLAGLSGGMYLPNFWLLPESARWLIQKGRAEDGLKVLKRISRMNGTEKHFNEVLQIKGATIVAENVPQTGINEIARVFFRSGIAARYITLIFFWFVAALVYYGVAYYSTSFSEDRFLNVLYAGLAEFPALFLGFYMVKFIGRPRTAFVLMLLCAISNIILPFVPEAASALTTTLSMLGKGAVSAAFFVVYLLSTEIAPTLQRGSCMALCNLSARIASLISPFVMYTSKIHPFVSNGIMGAIGLVLAVLVIFYIPETKGVPMPDSVEEARSNNRIYGLNVFRSLAPAKGKSGKSSDAHHREALL